MRQRSRAMRKAIVEGNSVLAVLRGIAKLLESRSALTGGRGARLAALHSLKADESAFI